MRQRCFGRSSEKSALLVAQMSSRAQRELKFWSTGIMPCGVESSTCVSKKSTGPKMTQIAVVTHHLIEMELRHQNSHNVNNHNQFRIEAIERKFAEKNAHSTIQVRCDPLLLLLTGSRYSPSIVFCSSMSNQPAIRCTRSASSSRHYRRSATPCFQCRISFGEEWLQCRHFTSLC
jgi:hypothetical protein